MERLTIRNSDGSVSQPTSMKWAEALDRLAAYEDTGLGPADMAAVKLFAASADPKKAARIIELHPGTCYKCGKPVRPGFGFFELNHGQFVGGKWRVQCVACCDGRNVKETDPEVKRALRLRRETDNERRQGCAFQYPAQAR